MVAKNVKSLVLVAGVALAGNSMAQEVSSTKSAPKVNVFNGISAKTDLRLRSDTFSKEGAYSSETTRSATEARLAIEAKLLNEKLTTTAVLGVSTKPDDTSVRQRRPEIEAVVSAYKATYGEIAPFLNIRTPFTGSGTDAKIGIRPSVTSTPIATLIGSMEAYGEAELYANTASRSRQIPVDGAEGKDATALNLTTDSKGQIVATEDKVSSVTEYRTGVKYVPAILGNALTVDASTMFGKEFTRQVAIDADDQKVYSTGFQNYSDLKLEVSYKISDVLVVRNETVKKSEEYLGGAWRGTDASEARLTNLTGLKYTLF